MTLSELKKLQDEAVSALEKSDDESLKVALGALLAIAGESFASQAKHAKALKEKMEAISIELSDKIDLIHQSLTRNVYQYEDEGEEIIRTVELIIDEE